MSYNIIYCDILQIFKSIKYHVTKYLSSPISAVFIICKHSLRHWGTPRSGTGMYIWPPRGSTHSISWSNVFFCSYIHACVPARSARLPLPIACLWMHSGLVLVLSALPFISFIKTDYYSCIGSMSIPRYRPGLLKNIHSTWVNI